jgi:hypothetical protein
MQASRAPKTSVIDGAYRDAEALAVLLDVVSTQSLQLIEVVLVEEREAPEVADFVVTMELPFPGWAEPRCLQGLVHLDQVGAEPGTPAVAS